MKVISKAKNLILGYLSGSKHPFLKRLYWEMRVEDIHAAWGEGKEDFVVIREIIRLVSPATLLDIGCGSGRLIPLFRELNVPEIVAQDVAKSALNLCKKRFPDINCKYEIKDIKDLSYRDGYFDLIISNRVLSAILPENIDVVLASLARLGKNIYINELSESDDTGQPSKYWFKHDYESFKSKHGFRELRRGTIGRQTWVLYGNEKSGA